VVCLIGLVITATVTWTAWTLNRHNEHRLLVVQTRQAADVLAATILSLENPLATAQQIATATGGDPARFRQFMAPYIGPDRLFVSASLWQRAGPSVKPVASVGVAAIADPGSGTARAFVLHALHGPPFVVTGIPTGRPVRVGYGAGNPTSPYAVYAERAIPPSRRVPVESTSAFADLKYATYLGPTTRTAELATTDVPVNLLPLSGDISKETVPFGDTTLTLVTSPIGQLGGTLGATLPWIFLAAGIVLTVATAIVADQLVRRRRGAEQSARTIAGLYDRLDRLFREQRSIAETLQEALIPQLTPQIRNLETASRYVAGADGVEIGGDWFTMVPVGDDRFAFAVGDVSGRGIGAASFMARLQFSIRAYLREGHPPERVLQMCADELDIDRDRHFSTALVGVGALDTREITLASAGHLPPLLLAGPAADYQPVPVGPPLGVTGGVYRAVTLVMPPASTLLAFTDGLVERRGESVDVGLTRLAEAAGGDHGPLESLLSEVLPDTEHATRDDVAVLAFRWSTPERSEPDPPARSLLTVPGR
jgi:serine phosphatase RsbU (regulator of sigma subunit)